MIRKRDLAQVAREQSLKMHSQIQSGNFIALQDTMNLICRTITNVDEFINDEFINAVVKEVYGEFGGDQLIATERGYPIDFNPQEKTKMEVNTACGKKVLIDSVKCNMPYSSEVFTQYYDYLTVNKQKTLPVTITQDQLRKISCGENTFNQLRNLILSKVTESIEAYIRDEVYCILNTPENYKTIAYLNYVCDSNCDDGFISALTQFAINLQINAKDYNLANRLYDLPIKSKAWLLNSTKLAAKLASRYARGGTNASYIDISSKFARTFDIPQLKIADGIIMDINWLQVRKVFTELVWKYEPSARAECGVYNLDMKIKPINFFTAVPFQLVEITKKEKDTADSLVIKIDNLDKIYSIDNQIEAETQIKADINALNTSTDPKLNLVFTFSDFKMPNNTSGSINMNVKILNAQNTVINFTNHAFTLQKKQTKNTIEINDEDIVINTEAPVTRIINNFTQLKNLKVVVDDTSVATANLTDALYSLTVIGLKRGTATCTLSADNVKDVQINISVEIS